MLFVSSPIPVFLNEDQQVDGLELRLDLFPNWEMDDIRKFLASSKLPVMLTLRKKEHGGAFEGDEEERERCLLELLQLKPSFIDLEWDMREDFLHQVMASYPQTRVILSYHNFDKTPENLDLIYSSMKKHPAFGFKIATFVHSTNDAIRMLLLSKKNPSLSTICMGEKGGFARVLGPVVGNIIDYACLSTKEKTAPGQLTISDYIDTYRYRTLNPKTYLYGLIGDPVDKSVGHLHHNATFSKKGINAVYVKMEVKQDELATFFLLAKELGFLGLSVTMPLKESVLPFIHEKDAHVLSCKASNTLGLRNGKIAGTNTDGRGALDAIEKKRFVKNQVMVLLGSGGSARAIAAEAKKRGAILWILNRTIEKAQMLAKELDCKYGSLSQFPPRYDILVNTCPETDFVKEDDIQPNALFMDIVYVPKETAFLKLALRKKGEIVYGEEMFFAQAALQTEFWLQNATNHNPPFSTSFNH